MDFGQNCEIFRVLFIYLVEESNRLIWLGFLLENKYLVLDFRITKMVGME